MESRFVPDFFWFSHLTENTNSLTALELDRAIYLHDSNSNMNSKENNSGTNLTNHNYEEDNCSNYSGESQVSARPDAVSQEQPIRVRDMIKLYNYATQKNQELEFAKSAYFGKASNQQQAGEAFCNDQAEGGSR